jgi:hypothetical protein
MLRRCGWSGGVQQVVLVEGRSGGVRRHDRLLVREESGVRWVSRRSVCRRHQALVISSSFQPAPRGSTSCEMSSSSRSSLGAATNDWRQQHSVADNDGNRGVLLSCA